MIVLPSNTSLSFRPPKAFKKNHIICLYSGKMVLLHRKKKESNSGVYLKI